MTETFDDADFVERTEDAGQNQAEYFTCPCCGFKAPIERLTEQGPFKFEVWRQTYGGKRAFTPEERSRMKGRKPRRGGAPGVMAWSPRRTLKRHMDAIRKRVQAINLSPGI